MRFFFQSVLTIAILLPSFAAQAGGLPLVELLTSRAGRFIFTDVAEGTHVARRLVGLEVATSAERAESLAKVLQGRPLRKVADDLESRLNRIYEAYARENPNRAEELFGRGGGELTLTVAERTTLRELAARELDRPFVESIPMQRYADTRARFQAAEGSAPISARGRALIYWETRANGAGLRSHLPMQIENYEIPMDLLQADVARRMPKELAESLIFERNGKRFVRWVINPEDTVHYKQVEKFLVSKGIRPVRHKTFTAYQTSSRSYIISDVRGGKRIEFSAKVSTNKTGGMWKDKKQPVEDALEVRRATDFVAEQRERLGFKNLVIMDEPAMFGIAEIDQAMLIRSLAALPEGEVTYLPGFSTLHEDLGVRIARANGSSNPAEFWNEHYNKPLARALSEFAAKTGLTYDSPHSQNFLIEMVGIRPTGRIVLRDFGDTYAAAEILEAMGKQDFLRNWDKDNIIQGGVQASIGVLHGNEFPSWMDAGIYRKWGQDFYRAWEAEFSAQTGIPASELSARLSQENRYFSKQYPIQGKAWEAYLKRLGVQAESAAR